MTVCLSNDFLTGFFTTIQKMIEALRHFENQTIFDRYYSVGILPIPLGDSIECLLAVRHIRAVMEENKNRHTGLVRIFDSTFHVSLLSQVERSLVTLGIQKYEQEKEHRRYLKQII